jgi:hypothetical protein
MHFKQVLPLHKASPSMSRGTMVTIGFHKKKGARCVLKVQSDQPQYFLPNAGI